MKDVESTSYRCLPLQLHRDAPLRYLYLKPAVLGGDGGAADQQEDFARDCALFVAGLPAELDETTMLHIFAAYGEVERVALHGSRVSAVVVYASKKGRDSALKAAAKGKIAEIDLPAPSGPRGLKAWVEAHKAEKPGNAELQRRLDAWMEEWEAEEERKKAASLAAMQEDGWTVVQRHKGRKKNADAASATVVGGVAAAAAAARAAAKAKTAKYSTDFYRFQQRSRRRSELMELREQFEQDKRKLLELKAARKFKPLG
jgi:ribosomal RNA-processing protein 7